MYGLVTVRRVQNGLIRPGIPFPTNLTRRTAHSGLLDSICGDYQRGLITFNSRPFPSKNPQLWSFVRTRDRHQRRPFRLALTRKVPCFLLPSPPPFLHLLHRKISKSLSFFPLRDSYGTTQLVVHRDQTNTQKLAALSAVPPESVVLIQGRVRSRPNHSKRSVCFTSLTRPPSLAPHVLISFKDPTGSIEVSVQEFIVLNPADRNLPFPPSENRDLVRVSLLSIPPSTCFLFFHFVGRPTTMSAPNTATWTFADPLCHKTCANEARLPTLSAISSMTKVQSHYRNPFPLSLIQFLQISSKSKPPFSKDRVQKVPENSLCKLASVLVTITLSSTLCNNHRSSPNSY